MLGLEHHIKGNFFFLKQVEMQLETAAVLQSSS